MNNLAGILEAGFAPLFMSVSDMLLLFYLCGGTLDYIRRKKTWGILFVVFLALLMVSQFIYNGKTNAQANFIIFYAVHFFLLLIYSTFCTDVPRNARIYLVILSVLANDVCLIAIIALSSTLFGFDYIDSGTFAERVVAHIVLLVMKIGATMLIKKQTKSQIYGIESVFQAVVIILPALPFFLLRNYAYFFRIDPFLVPLIIHYLDVLCGIIALINMVISERLSYQIRQNDILRMENLIKKQYDQYQSTLNTIETVNRKYHDLRHILRGIDSMQDITEIKSYVRSIEGEILDYELICNTGNKAMDIILSERIQECKEKQILMHVHADGQGWEYVRDADIATVFGNALDNAIEYSEQNTDHNQRIIDVRTGRVNDMLIARFENSFSHILEKKQARLITTKTDKQNHGFGLQSIELTVKKYGGDMDINTENGLFTLTVIIPALNESAG